MFLYTIAHSSPDIIIVSVQGLRLVLDISNVLSSLEQASILNVHKLDGPVVRRVEIHSDAVDGVYTTESADV
jgi:hypothetical protein